jgi:hypothetical protein
MNKDKLKQLLILLGELEIHLKINMDMGRQMGGTQGHKWGSRLNSCKEIVSTVKNMLTER